MNAQDFEFKDYCGVWKPLTQIMQPVEMRLKPKPPKPREWWIYADSVYHKPIPEAVHVREVIE